MKKQGYYVGIDLDDKYAVVSFYEPGMKEPQTVSMVTGSDVFQVPVLIAKRKGLGQWFVGEEAKRIAEKQQVTAIDQLLSRAKKKETLFIDGEYYQAEELLLLFLKKLIGYAGGISTNYEPQMCAISVEKLEKDLAKLLTELGERLGFDKEELIVIDRKAAFYYFVFNQQKELWLHDVHLFDYRDGVMKCINLHRNNNTVPQLVSISEQTAEMNQEEQDESFCQVLSECMKGHVVSTVYLVGNGFDGEWMKLSLAYMCRGRRAFIGKNLYAKGCCYAVMVSQNEIPWSYTYIGDHEMKVNVSLKVKNRGVEEFYTLLRAGDNCYEAEGACEVILSDTRNISIWLQLPNSKQANVETLTLSDLPERESKTTRLRITAKPLSYTKIQIQIKDLGFGEIVKSSNLHWEYTMSI